MILNDNFALLQQHEKRGNISAMKCIQVYLIRNCFLYIHFYNHNDDLPED